MARIPRGRDPTGRRSATTGRHRSTATPAVVKAVWESMERPSPRRVALALTQAGDAVSAPTVRLWKKNGWRRTTDPVEEPEPNGELDGAVAVPSGDSPERAASDEPDRDRADDDPGRRSGMRRFRHCDVTPVDAKAVWQSMEKPSPGRVALALALAGKKVSDNTVKRWKKAGWRRGTSPFKEPEPMAELDAAVPVLTGDPLKRLASLTPGPSPADDDPSDEERIARGLRELAACTVRVLGVVTGADAALLMAAPDKIGVLLEKAGNALLAAIEGLAKLTEIRGPAAADVTPQRDNVAIHPLAGMLDAIRRARAIFSTEQPISTEQPT